MPPALHRVDPCRSSPNDCAIFILDKDGYVISWHAGKELFDTSKPKNFLGRHYASLYGGLHGTQSLNTALQADGSGQKLRWETWLEQRNGQRLRVEIAIYVLSGKHGYLPGFVMTVRDIMPSRFAQERLRESERRFRLFTQAATDYALCMLDAYGNILDWNAGAQRVTGFSARNVIGKSICIFFRGEGLSNDLPSIILKKTEQEGRAWIDCELIRRNGEAYPAHIVMEAVHEADGCLLGFALIIRDRTEQQLAERRLREARAQIVHAQKIEAVGQLTGGIAHDFNNALQGIISSLELALVCLDQQHHDQAKRHVTISLDAALRAGRLTQRLLCLAHRHATLSHCTSVPVVLQSMRELLERTLGDGIELAVSFPDKLPTLACDGAQLESALVNLAINARDAISGHGHISLSARVCNTASTDALIALDPSHETYIELVVSDNGPGMSEETRQRALEPFFTTKPEGHGTGLGLSMVHEFVTRHGGAIDIRSAPGAGTSVVLYLPCDDTDIATPAASDHKKAAPDLKGFRIMVAEDNETIRHAVATRLRQLGCDVSEADSGQEALSLLCKESHWDLLLSDIDLPQLDGYALCSQARKHFPALQIILMTGYSDLHRLDFHDPARAIEALIKPFDMGELLAKAQLLLQTAQ